MLEDALKNLFPYKDISLKTGDTVNIEFDMIGKYNGKFLSKR